MVREATRTEEILRARLKRRFWAAAGLAALALLAAGLGLSLAWQPNQALRWTLPAAAILTYLLLFLRRRLPDNRSPEGLLLSGFGPGTWLSLARGAALALLAGFLLPGRPPGPLAWAPAALYTFAALADLFDGYLARRSRHATPLGEALDLELDALGMLLAVALAVRLGALSAWFLPFGLARYAFAFGLWLRRRRRLPVHDLPPSRARRPIAGLTMGFLCAALWPIARPPATTLGGVVFLLPFGLSFLRDWLVVSGRLDPDSAAYLQLRQALADAFLHYLPLPLRLLTATLLGQRAWAALADPAAAALPYASLGFRAPGTVAVLFAVLEGAAALALAAGFAGRLAAFLAVFPLGLTAVAAGLTPAAALALTGDLGVLILGTGLASLWAPEGRWLGRRWGESDP